MKSKKRIVRYIQVYDTCENLVEEIEIDIRIDILISVIKKHEDDDDLYMVYDIDESNCAVFLNAVEFDFDKFSYQMITFLE